MDQGDTSISTCVPGGTIKAQYPGTAMIAFGTALLEVASCGCFWMPDPAPRAVPNDRDELFPTR